MAGLDEVHAALRPRRAARWRLVAPLLVGAAVLAGWAVLAEWRHGARLLAALPAVAGVVAAGSAGPEQAARALDALAAAVAGVEAGAKRSPFGRLGPGAVAHTRYVEAVDALLPGLVHDALASSLATAGGALALYDTLRTVAILEGQGPLEPGFVAGWLAGQAPGDPAAAALARHARALSGPPSELPAQDRELLGQARAIAAEGDPVAMALLELARDPRMEALPRWSPAEIPELAAVLDRRSGRPVDQPMPGLFTAAGWVAAQDGAARDAIARAEAGRARVIGGPAPTPVELEGLLEELQRRTLAAWSAELADLRVRAFTGQPSALAASAALGRAGSPLEALFRAAWHEVGGDDPGRSHLGRLRIAAAFGPAARFVEEEGMDEIAALFARVNGALARLGPDAEVGRLTDAGARAAAVDALNRAPRPVVQIVEDVLAQTIGTQGGLLKPRAALVWQRDLAGACRFALAGRYPFAPGPDADLALVSDLIGPSGTLARFFAADLAPLMDTSEPPWRWKPEARLSGFRPESAAFLERAAAAGEALFPADGVGLTLATLAGSAAATVSLGGAAVPVTSSGPPAALAWPGPEPADGLRVALATEAGVERDAWSGPWGLMRFLDGIRLRALDGGQEYLLDARLEKARAYLELGFGRPANPALARGIVAGLACPASL